MDARFPDDITMLKAWLTHWAEDAGRKLPVTTASLLEAMRTVRRIEQREAETAETLEACEAYFDNRSDVSDGDYGIPEPNEEMRLLTMVRASLQSLQTKEEASNA
jgi:hypothetical protein